MASAEIYFSARLLVNFLEIRQEASKIFKGFPRTIFFTEFERCEIFYLRGTQKTTKAKKDNILFESIVEGMMSGN